MAIAIHRPSLPRFTPTSPRTPDTVDVPIPAAILGHPALAAAGRLAEARALGYAGDLAPRDAHEVAQAGLARIIDVRTAEERKFVGYVPESVHLPWATGTAMARNPRFIRELEAKAARSDILLFLCRCGPRSAAAAAAAARAGFRFAFNVSEGFEGDLDADGHRGGSGGWRFHGLPWLQD